jgi:hypothetical protein
MQHPHFINNMPDNRCKHILAIKCNIRKHKISKGNIANQHEFPHPIAEIENERMHRVHLGRGSSSKQSRRRCRTAAARPPPRCAAAWACPGSPAPPPRRAWDRQRSGKGTPHFQDSSITRSKDLVKGKDTKKDSGVWASPADSRWRERGPRRLEQLLYRGSRPERRGPDDGGGGAAQGRHGFSRCKEDGREAMPNWTGKPLHKWLGC